MGSLRSSKRGGGPIGPLFLMPVTIPVTVVALRLVEASYPRSVASHY